MRLPEAADQPDEPAWLDDLPRATLDAMLAAGREVLQWRRILAKTGDNLVGEDRPGGHGHFHTFLRGGGMPEGGSQWTAPAGRSVRRLEVTSQLPVSAEAQVEMLECRLARPAEAPG